MRGKMPVGLVCGLMLLAACGRGADEGASEPRAGAPAGGTAGEGAATTGSTPGSATADGASRAQAARAAAAAWPKVEGRWTQGDVDSRYVAHFDGGQLRYLVEAAPADDADARRSEYWFEDGELYYYSGEKPSAYGGTGPGALPPNVPIVMEFRGADVVRAVSREHYGEKKLADEAVQRLRRHAAALAGAAQDEWSARQAQ